MCQKSVEENCDEPELTTTVSNQLYGYAIDDYEVVLDTVRSGDTFGKLMDNFGVSAGQVYQIVEKVKDTFDVRQLRAGRPFTLLRSKDSLNKPQVFIYHPNRIDYVVIDMRDSIQCYRDKLPVTTKRRTVTGVINSSLSQAMTDQGLSQNLVHELSSIYQWTVDFFRLQKGDHFKIIYNENYINDTTFVGIENVEATLLNHYNRPYYAFRFTTDSLTGTADYYDEKANTLRSFFLKAPLNYTRISSRYSLNRFHPVQKKWKAHLGTDYAAPHGTPIMATANGVVERSGYNSGNGNYVKIKHNDTYSTQYLHMSKSKYWVE
jgi:murein DD-endopeptidase MepM/ murein hydrolase activator NlpD